MQIYASDHVEVHPQKKKEVLYLAKNKKKKYKKDGLRNVMDICMYVCSMRKNRLEIYFDFS